MEDLGKIYGIEAFRGRNLGSRCRHGMGTALSLRNSKDTCSSKVDGNKKWEIDKVLLNFFARVFL